MQTQGEALKQLSDSDVLSVSCPPITPTSLNTRTCLHKKPRAAYLEPATACRKHPGSFWCDLQRGKNNRCIRDRHPSRGLRTTCPNLGRSVCDFVGARYSDLLHCFNLECWVGIDRDRRNLSSPVQLQEKCQERHFLEMGDHGEEKT